MKIVKIENGIVKEVLPESTYEKGVIFWYGEAFASKCIEAPDDIKQGMVYDQTKGTFEEPAEEVRIGEKSAEERIEELEQLVADLASLQLGV